jgi:transcriptional regulator with XRE-family HTH domain
MSTTKLSAPSLSPPDAREVRSREQLEGLARRIRGLREQKGLTQEEFAKRCGISVSFASLLERGARSPSYETLVEVAQALELPMAELFRDSPLEAHDDPYYARLVDFARKGKLSHSKVDQLISVGHAMFGLDHAPKLAAAARTASAECTTEGCTRQVLAKGLCASHYHRARRARL